MFARRLERIESLAASGRWTPASLDLKIALDNSRLNQTYNTPALATIHMLASQIKWINDNGGLSFSAGRSRTSAEILYTWPKRRPSPDPSSRIRHFAATSSERSTLMTTSTRRTLRKSFERTGSWTLIPIANLVEINCGSQCSRAWTPRTSLRSARASITSSGISSVTEVPTATLGCTGFVTLIERGRHLHRIDEFRRGVVGVLVSRVVL